MSERIYWRQPDDGSVTEQNGPAAAPSLMRRGWERVHVLTDAELAAEKAKWQAEERERIAVAIEAMPEDRNPTLHELLDSGQMYADWIYGYGRAWGTDAARIARQGGSDDER